MAENVVLTNKSGITIYPFTVASNIIDLKSNTVSSLNGQTGDITGGTISAGSTVTGKNDTVTEYYLSSDGNTWYRIWSSGWKECGGYIIKSTSDYQRITFPITFTNTNYTSNLTAYYGEDGSSFWWAFTQDRTTSYIDVWSGYTSINGTGGGRAVANGVSWYCCGY